MCPKTQHSTKEESHIDVASRFIIIPNIEELEITKYVKHIDSDPIVSEIVHFIVENPTFLPIAPDLKSMNKTLSFHPKVNLDNDTLKICMSNMFSYFEVCYFQNNLIKACEHDIALFSPTVGLHIPQFNVLAEFYFTRVTGIKQSMALQIQKITSETIKIQTELFFCRTLKAIIDDLSKKISTRDQIWEQHINHFLTVSYCKGKVEVFSVFPAKDIDWKTKQSKVRHTLPYWRKDNNGNTPEQTNNRFTQGIFRQIDQGILEFNGPSVQKGLHISKTQSKEPEIQFSKIGHINHNRKSETMGNQSQRHSSHTKTKTSNKHHNAHHKTRRNHNTQHKSKPHQPPNQNQNNSFKTNALASHNHSQSSNNKKNIKSKASFENPKSLVGKAFT